MHGLHIPETCEWVNLKNPEDVAIFGVDNHPIFSKPHLTSIERRIGQFELQSTHLLLHAESRDKPSKYRRQVRYTHPGRSA